MAAVACACGLSAGVASAQSRQSELEATLRVCTTGGVAALARAERRRGEAQVTSAGVLPNPALVAEHQRTLRGPSEQETIVGVSVPLGIGGRRFILKNAAAARLEQARADAAATLFDAAVAFRAAYARAMADQARLDVLAEQQAGLESLSTVIQGLATGGEAAGYDLLRQQALARRHRSTLEAVRAQAVASRAILQAWLGDELPFSSLELTGMTGSPLPAGGEAGMSPELASLEASARASSFEATAARRRWVPDLELFAGYRSLTTGSETGQGIALGLTLPITFFDHGQGEAALAEADRAVALALAGKLRHERRARMNAARARLEGLTRALAEAGDAVLETAAIRQKAQRLYTAGEGTITELLETFRAAEEARLARIDLLEEQAQARLSFMQAAGTMFDAMLDRACRVGGNGILR